MARRLSKLLIIPLLAVFQFGCDPDPEYSDLEQWEIDLSPIDAIPDDPNHVLVGSQIFVEIIGQRDASGNYDELDGELRSCVHLFGNGTVEWIDTPDDDSGPHALVAAAGPGSIVISAPHEACPDYSGPAEDFVRDAWSMTGVDLADTTGNWMAFYDYYALVLLTGGPADFPDAIGLLEGPVQVAEGGTFNLFGVLTHVVDGEVVEVRDDRPDRELVLPEPYQSWLEEPYLWTLAAGEQVDARLVYGSEAEVALPTLEGVPVDRIASLELVALYEPDESGERDWGLPAGVIAIARDAEGRRVMGAPIEWSVSRGLLALDGPADASDLAVVGDTCRNRPVGRDSRDATIEARVGDLVASVDLEWTALRDDAIEIDTDSALCQGSACDCSATATPSDSLAAVFGLLLLGGVLRRRRCATRMWGSEPNWHVFSLVDRTAKPDSFFGPTNIESNISP